MERVSSTVTPPAINDVDSDKRLWPIVRQLLKWSPGWKNYCAYALRATLPPVKNLGSGEETDALSLTPQTEFLKSHHFDVKKILRQADFNDTTGRLVSA